MTTIAEQGQNLSNFLVPRTELKKVFKIRLNF